MRTVLFPAILAATLAAAAESCPPHAVSAVSIGPQHWRVETAVKPSERIRGLSHRPALPRGEGMLFILDAPGRPGFWMKDMHFPLDLIWITRDGRVAGVTTAQPCGSGHCPTLTPAEEISRVLEVNAGEFHSQPGAQTTWHCFPGVKENSPGQVDPR